MFPKPCHGFVVILVVVPGRSVFTQEKSKFKVGFLKLCRL